MLLRPRPRLDTDVYEKVPSWLTSLCRFTIAMGSAWGAPPFCGRADTARTPARTRAERTCGSKEIDVRGQTTSGLKSRVRDLGMLYAIHYEKSPFPSPR